jgi:hypothetical protein
MHDVLTVHDQALSVSVDGLAEGREHGPSGGGLSRSIRRAEER